MKTQEEKINHMQEELRRIIEVCEEKIRKEHILIERCKTLIQRVECLMPILEFKTTPKP